MIPCFLGDNKLGDRLIVGVDISLTLEFTDHDNGNWWTYYSRDNPFKHLGIIWTLEDHHKHWICRINGLCSD